MLRPTNFKLHRRSQYEANRGTRLGKILPNTVDFYFFIRLIILEDFIRLISYNGPCVRLGCSFFLATALNWIKERQKRCPLRGSKCHCLSPKFWFIPNNVNLRYSMRLERKPDYFAKLYLLVKVKGLLPYIKLSIFFQLLPA